jgi:hypothetical protein
MLARVVWRVTAFRVLLTSMSFSRVENIKILQNVVSKNKRGQQEISMDK